MGIWTPKYHRDQGHTPTDSILFVTIGLRDITGTSLEIAEAIQLLRGYSVEEITAFSSFVSRCLHAEKQPTNSQATQLKICQRIFPEEFLRNVKPQLTADRPSFVFYDRQMLALLKISLSTLPLSSQTRRPTYFELGLACLAITDFLNELVDGTPLNHSHSRRESLDAHFFANFHFPQARSPLAEIGRTHAMLIANCDLKIDQLIRRSTGRSLEDYWACLYGIFCAFSSSEPSTFPWVRISKRDFLSSHFPITPEESATLIDTVSQCATDLRDKLPAEVLHTEDYKFDYLPFQRRPLIAFGDNIYCPSLPLLIDQLGLSFRHTLLDKETFSAPERATLLTRLGTAFEKYATSLLDRIYHERGISADKLPLSRKKRESTADYIAPYGDLAIIFEFKSISPILPLRFGITNNRRSNDILMHFVHALKQIQSTSKLISEGTLVSLGVPDNVTIIPIIVTLDYAVDPLLFWEILQQMKTNHIDEALLKNLHIFDIRDLELLELASKRPRGIPQLLLVPLQVSWTVG